MDPLDQQPHGNGDMTAAGDRAIPGHPQSGEELERTGRSVSGRAVGGAPGSWIWGRSLLLMGPPCPSPSELLYLGEGTIPCCAALCGVCSETSLLTPRLFGGLLRDIRRKAPWYGSDFSDALHPQCLSAVLYIYLATVTNAITFGGMLGDATANMQVSVAVGYQPYSAWQPYSAQPRGPLGAHLLPAPPGHPEHCLNSASFPRGGPQH